MHDASALPSVAGDGRCSSTRRRGPPRAPAPAPVRRRRRALLDHELIEYLLALAIPRRDTKPLAKALIARFGGIGPLLAADADALRREGLSDGVIAALKIAAGDRAAPARDADRGPPGAVELGRAGRLSPRDMAHSPIEQVRVLFLNAKNMLIANEAMWRGSVDEAAVHVREVIARAIELGATAIIIVHNHPCGDPSPSQQDIRLTRDLVEAGRQMGVTVHDHVIVGARGGRA